MKQSLVKVPDHVSLPPIQCSKLQSPMLAHTFRPYCTYFWLSTKTDYLAVKSVQYTKRDNIAVKV